MNLKGFKEVFINFYGLAYQLKVRLLILSFQVLQKKKLKKLDRKIKNSYVTQYR